ncbi:hypothetical protein KW782_00550 [Candidatus Parcubacteria bacterium]|nr:hypothetical protein [Candidatus Parcubacteria bacterium]
MNFLHYFIDILFPQPIDIERIEKMTAEDFISEAPQALEQISADIVSIFNYKHPLVQKTLWELKYRGNNTLARLLADILYDEIIEYLADEALFSGFTDPLLIPIPLSSQRLQERGWNQTEMIATALQAKDRNRSFMLEKNILKKIRHTEAQTKLSKSKRLKNLKGCFAVLEPEKIKKRNIILLDDVTTTGSTILEAKTTLLKSGARNVIAFSIAH